MALNPNEVFAKYIHHKRVLIADESGLSRSSIASLLIGMGAQTSLVSLSSSYTDAVELLKQHKPTVIICDYNMGKGKCGLDFLQMQRQANPESKNSLFILVTGNTSQSAVARAAEEDVDSYLLKPFTKESIRASVFKAAMLKIAPPPYLAAIRLGKEQLDKMNLKEAEEHFMKAKTLDPAPSLALGYLGQIEMIKKSLDTAQKDYGEGLGHMKIHYKCLVGLYDVLMEQKKFTDAYDAIKKIAKYFPANPKRLTSVLRLAILTSSFDDIEGYYRIFKEIDDRDSEMTRYVSAALIICGKYYLQRNLRTRALELFQKAAITSANNPKVLRDIISNLVDAHQVQGAQEFLNRFPTGIQTGPEYHVASFLILNESGKTSQIIDKGRELIGKGINDPTIFLLMIKRSKELQLGPAIEDLVQSASKLWPDMKAAFIA